MQRTRLKELITQLEELLTELKVEVYADKDAYIDSDGEQWYSGCLLYTSPSPRDRTRSRMPSSA